jgi:hypothetical protein
MQTDVKSVYLAATGTLVSYRARIKAIVVVSGAAAGSIILRDGGASGAIGLQMDIPASSVGTGAANSVFIPDNGILFETDVHATLSGCTVTAFHG